MWQARYDAFYALQARYPGTEIWVTDACVPISRLVAEHGEEAVSVMRALKLALDPDNLMNPGKIVRA